MRATRKTYSQGTSGQNDHWGAYTCKIATSTYTKSTSRLWNGLFLPEWKRNLIKDRPIAHLQAGHMGLQSYQLPDGVYAIPPHLLDLRSDTEIDWDLMNPVPVHNEMNIWFFWHSGFAHMHQYTQRNIRAWHRRFSRLGWVVRVLDNWPASASNVANFLELDLETFPRAFIDKTIGGDDAFQHMSDLVRWPLLLRYGGVYADVGIMQIGDLDKLWGQTVCNANSPIEVLSYTMAGVEGQDQSLSNYFMASNKHNPFFQRCHRLLLALWNGKTATKGMHSSPLLEALPRIGKGSNTCIEEYGETHGPEEASKLLTDYMIQGISIGLYTTFPSLSH